MPWTEDPVIDWLLAEGRLLPDFHHRIEELGRRLVAAGVPLSRLRCTMRTLHPLVTAVSVIWERDGAGAEVIEAAHGLESRAAYAGSPLLQIVESEKPLRRRLDRLGAEDHSAFHELRARGGTDYFGLPMRFVSGRVGVLVFVSDAAAGFSEDDLARLSRLARVMAPIVETHRWQLVSTAIAEAYLGPRTGPRVLAGQITRGNIETLDAAIMVSDIRGWTELNAHLPADAAMAIANRYFDLLDRHISAQGGEILKLMGDGLLAVFPVESDQAQACRRALAAAQAAVREAGDTPDLPIAFGIGLHLGDVLYGNIGSERRLDFTVLGQAVNLSARIEALCRRLDQPLLYSAAFAGMIGGRHRSFPPVTLKGIPEPQTVFAPQTKGAPGVPEAPDARK